MSRIEWSALSGEEVEAVLANLLYNDQEESIRLKPSKGDRGIDVLVPIEGLAGPWDVYQIKKFALTLTASQKAQIAKSLGRILVSMVREGFELSNWYLVTPLDPTYENLEWFKKLRDGAVKSIRANKKLAATRSEIDAIRTWLRNPDHKLKWRTLQYCESLAFKYPYVVDFYLHGGRDRLRDAVSEVAKLLQIDSTVRNSSIEHQEAEVALLTPSDVRDHLQRLDGILDTDPHYKYAHSLDVTRPSILPERNLVAATQEPIEKGRWLTFKIYQRSQQSLTERPIPIHLQFNFKDGPREEEEAFKLWLKYGKPAELGASISAQLPGGLGGDFSSARVRLGPELDDLGSSRNRLRIVAPGAETICELLFSSTITSGLDSTGHRLHGKDLSGAFEF